jgi:hypothetical protein
MIDSDPEGCGEDAKCLWWCWAIFVTISIVVIKGWEELKRWREEGWQSRWL